MSSPLIQTRGLQTGYQSGDTTTVTTRGPLTLEVRRGQLVCLIGPNGAGKSTLLRTIAGFHPPLKGNVEINGRDIRLHTPIQRARTVSLVLTDRVSTHHLDVYSLVALGRYPWSGWLGGLDSRDKAAIESAIDAAGIRPFLDRKIITLSDGEHQKVMLARALAQDTPLLMLDEPTAHLDLPSRIRLMRLLHRLAGQTGKGVLLSTHELELALQVADEVWLLQDAGVFHHGAPEDLVLTGAFEAAFAHEDIRFDKQTGTFTIEHENRRPVVFSGEGLAAQWTRRALQREGYYIVSPQDPAPPRTPPVVHVIENPAKIKWTLKFDDKNVQEFHSIAELLNVLGQNSL
jgi:iron complex transport system ATP-binding protein